MGTILRGGLGEALSFSAIRGASNHVRQVAHLLIHNHNLINATHWLSIFIYLFIYGCVGSPFLCEGFHQLWRAGATLHHGAWASHYRGLSCCGAQAPDAQAQQPWLTGPAAPRHVASSQTRARTRVPCISRQILNHCATREAQTGRQFLDQTSRQNLSTCKQQ